MGEPCGELAFELLCELCGLSESRSGVTNEREAALIDFVETPPDSG